MIKCLIWDLDDTLWTGTLVEDPEVRLRPGIAEILEQLDRRGILQSVASRNDHDQAMDKLTELGVQQFFLCPQIGTGSKADSIRQIAAALNIGTDAVAFIDDNPFERFEVQTRLPEVHVYDADAYSGLLAEPEFQPELVTRESSRRRELMISRFQREEAERQFDGSREQFLRSCAMELTVRPAGLADMERVCELALRTNQWNNFAGPLSDATIRAYVDSPDAEIYVAELMDRFGDHGIVATAMLDYSDERVHIPLFCISCRMEGRGIGTAFLGAVLDQVQEANPTVLAATCEYRSTGRNRPALILLQLLGFTRLERREDRSIYELTLPADLHAPDWMTIRRSRG